MELKAELGPAKKKLVSPPLPPPPPPLPRFCVAAKPAAKAIVTESVTNREIAKFWRQKQMEEEDHLLAALKAAARVRAQKLTENDYQRFEEWVGDVAEEDKAMTTHHNDKDDIDNELRVGIKDWWTKSKYAYLNQPAIGDDGRAVTPKRRSSSHVPNICSYKLSALLHPVSLGVV